MNLWPVLLYARTLRALRPMQLAYLPIRRLQRHLRAALPGAYARLYSRQATPTGTRPSGLAALAERISEILGGGDHNRRGSRRDVIRVLDQDVSLRCVDWEADVRPALWAYHLHYFDAAPPLALAAWRGDRESGQLLAMWIRQWIAGCRVGRGPGWDPFPLSQRLVNWIWCDALGSAWADAALRLELRSSALQQTAYLADHMEFQLMGNHLLKNAKALYLAALVWGHGSRAERWRARAERLLAREVDEQVLGDGGHFERSPMYHDMVYQDLLEVALIAAALGVPAPVPRDVLRRMAAARAALRHPDGMWARFNDVVDGLVATPGQVDAIQGLYEPDGQPVPMAALALPDSGYFGYRDESRGEYLVADAGPPGPRYQPGHAHCDLLSFELSLWGERWIVDPGASGYADDPFRAYARSTRAHNTLVIGGREQSELWGSFRMGRSARVAWARTRVGSDVVWELDGAYRPYYDDRILHRRVFSRTRDGLWRVRDTVSGADGATIEGALHFHPSVTVELQGNGLVCRRGDRRLVLRWEEVLASRLERSQHEPPSGWYFPRYGIAEPTITVRYRQGPEAGFQIVPG
ncbi:MAG TPA: alginate lyase family protein [Gemmatimonadales bacterium]|nr:alginate lyase family protein [Gemmatimonadales bacterium]